MNETQHLWSLFTLYPLIMEGIYSIYDYLVLLGCSKGVLNKYRSDSKFRRWVYHYMSRSWDKDYVPRIERECLSWAKSQTWAK